MREPSKLIIQVWIKDACHEGYWLSRDEGITEDQVFDEAWMQRNFANKMDRWRIIRITEEVVWPRMGEFR